MIYTSFSVNSRKVSCNHHWLFEWPAGIQQSFLRPRGYYNTPRFSHIFNIRFRERYMASTMSMYRRLLAPCLAFLEISTTGRPRHLLPRLGFQHANVYINQFHFFLWRSTSDGDLSAWMYQNSNLLSYFVSKGTTWPQSLRTSKDFGISQYF